MCFPESDAFLPVISTTASTTRPVCFGSILTGSESVSSRKTGALLYGTDKLAAHDKGQPIPSLAEAMNLSEAQIAKAMMTDVFDESRCRVYWDVRR